MTVVVSGASGHVGGNLIRELLRQGRRVRAIVREDIRAVDGLDLELVRADVLDRQSLDAALVGAEVVYHLAARISVIGDPDGSVYRTNVLGTRNMVSAALEAGVSRFVHFSSIHAFSRYPKQGMIDESRPLTEGKDVPAYDKTKAQGEREVARGVADGLDAVIINPTAVIGPHDYKPSHMGQFFCMSCQGRLPGLLRGGFDWVDVRDVVQGALTAEKVGKTGERYILSGQWRTVGHLAKLVEQVAGVRQPRLIAPIWLARLGLPFVALWAKLTGKPALFTHDSISALNNHRHINADKAKRELNYRTRPLEETVADTVEWLKKNRLDIP